MNLDEWVYQEEERIDELWASGEIDRATRERMLRELYREAREYEREEQ